MGQAPIILFVLKVQEAAQNTCNEGYFQCSLSQYTHHLSALAPTLRHTVKARQDKFSKLLIAYSAFVNKRPEVIYKLFSEEEKFYGAKSDSGLYIATKQSCNTNIGIILAYLLKRAVLLSSLPLIPTFSIMSEELHVQPQCEWDTRLI